MGAILEYKCPCCSGPLQFDTDAQKMKCPYCDNEFDAETLKSNDDKATALQFLPDRVYRHR